MSFNLKRYHYISVTRYHTIFIVSLRSQDTRMKKILDYEKSVSSLTILVEILVLYIHIYLYYIYIPLKSLYLHLTVIPSTDEETISDQKRCQLILETHVNNDDPLAYILFH
jgi:hypothetical protein